MNSVPSPAHSGNRPRLPALPSFSRCAGPAREQGVGGIAARSLWCLGRWTSHHETKACEAFTGDLLVEGHLDSRVCIKNNSIVKNRR